MTIELLGISFAYQSKQWSGGNVFDELNLSIQSGECVGIIGNEGAGKTTLLQLIAGLVKPKKGSVRIDGMDLHAKRSKLALLRRQIGFAFQFPEQQFFCETVREEMLYSSINQRIAASLAPLEALRLLGVHDESYLDRSPFSLSMGEARRVALATLLMMNPRILLLDEPTAGLDGFGMDLVLKLLCGIKAEGKTIVITSHDVDILTEVATRIVVLDEGKVQEDGEVAAVLTDSLLLARYGYSTPEVIRLMKEAQGVDAYEFHTFSSAVSVLKKSPTRMGLSRKGNG